MRLKYSQLEAISGLRSGVLIKMGGFCENLLKIGLFYLTIKCI